MMQDKTCSRLVTGETTIKKMCDKSVVVSASVVSFGIQLQVFFCAEHAHDYEHRKEAMVTDRITRRALARNRALEANEGTLTAEELGLV